MSINIYGLPVQYLQSRLFCLLYLKVAPFRLGYLFTSRKSHNPDYASDLYRKNNCKKIINKAK